MSPALYVLLTIGAFQDGLAMLHRAYRECNRHSKCLCCTLCNSWTYESVVKECTIIGCAGSIYENSAFRNCNAARWNTIEKTPCPLSICSTGNSSSCCASIHDRTTASVWCNFCRQLCVTIRWGSFAGTNCTIYGSKILRDKGITHRRILVGNPYPVDALSQDS